MFGLASGLSSTSVGLSAGLSAGLLSGLATGFGGEGGVSFLGGVVSLVEVSATSFLGYDGAYSSFS